MKKGKEEGGFVCGSSQSPPGIMLAEVLKVKIINISQDDKTDHLSKAPGVCSTVPGTVYILEHRSCLHIRASILNFVK